MVSFRYYGCVSTEIRTTGFSFTRYNKAINCAPDGRRTCECTPVIGALCLLRKILNKEYTDNIEEIATFGLDGVDPEEKVAVNLTDLLYVFSTLQEYQRFFHQPSHYESLEDVQRFLGSENDQADINFCRSPSTKKCVICFQNTLIKNIRRVISIVPSCLFYYKSDKTKT